MQVFNNPSTDSDCGANIEEVEKTEQPHSLLLQRREELYASFRRALWTNRSFRTPVFDALIDWCFVPESVDAEEYIDNTYTGWNILDEVRFKRSNCSLTWGYLHRILPIDHSGWMQSQPQSMAQRASQQHSTHGSSQGIDVLF